MPSSKRVQDRHCLDVSNNVSCVSVFSPHMYDISRNSHGIPVRTEKFIVCLIVMSQLNWCYCIHCECMRVAYDDVILDCYVDWHGCNIFGSLCVLRRIRAMSLFLLLVETHCSKHVTCSMLLCFGCPTASARLVPATQPQTL